MFQEQGTDHLRMILETATDLQYQRRAQILHITVVMYFNSLIDL